MLEQLKEKNYITFTIQNVSIKFKKGVISSSTIKNLQYKMFLLNKIKLPIIFQKQ